MASYEIFQSEYSDEQIESAIANSAPIIGTNGNWLLWNIGNMQWTDTGVKANVTITGGIIKVNGKFADQSGNVNTAMTKTVTLSGWVDNEITITDSFFEPNGYAYTVAPQSSDFSDWKNAVIWADDVTTNAMTFHCENTPSGNITAVILKVVVA